MSFVNSNEVSFQEYLSEVLLNAEQLYYNYNGILKKDFPKWAGWKIINHHKITGTHIKKIEDPELDILVKNFHYLHYIEKYVWKNLNRQLERPI